jgi:hypothetical protein
MVAPHTANRASSVGLGSGDFFERQILETDRMNSTRVYQPIYSTLDKAIMDSQDPKQSSPSLPFQSLPLELLSKIFRYLPQGTLCQLALVNKHINQFTVPVLCESFHQHGGDSTKVRQYFRIAQRVPELAKHLRDVTIQGCLEITHKQARKCFRKLDKESWVQHLHMNDAQLAYKYFSYGPDLAILLLLSLDSGIRSIRALHPPNPTRYGSNFVLPLYLEPIRGILAAGNSLPPWTGTLSTLEISLREISWQCIAPLFRLPVLKTLILDGGNELVDRTEPRMTAVPPRSSSIEELDFARCGLSLEIITNAVSACKTLRILRCYTEVENEGDNLRLIKILQEHVSTMHTLKIRCGESADSQLINGGSFADFAALVQLEMHYSNVIPSRLPPNLRRLVLCAHTADVAGLMEDMTMLAPKLSNLQHLDVILDYVHSRTGRHQSKRVPKLHQLPSIFANYDLNLSLHVSPPIDEICKYIPETILSNVS